MSVVEPESCWLEIGVEYGLPEASGVVLEKPDVSGTARSVGITYIDDVLWVTVSSRR
jgi:hypothetical protein